MRTDECSKRMWHAYPAAGVSSNARQVDLTCIRPGMRSEIRGRVHGLAQASRSSDACPQSCREPQNRGKQIGGRAPTASAGCHFDASPGFAACSRAHRGAQQIKSILPPRRLSRARVGRALIRRSSLPEPHTHHSPQPSRAHLLQISRPAQNRSDKPLARTRDRQLASLSLHLHGLKVSGALATRCLARSCRRLDGCSRASMLGMASGDASVLRTHRWVV